VKLTAKRQVEIVDEFEIDDRIHDEQCAAGPSRHMRLCRLLHDF
jgi:hypothetical protein